MMAKQTESEWNFGLRWKISPFWACLNDVGSCLITVRTYKPAIYIMKKTNFYLLYCRKLLLIHA